MSDIHNRILNEVLGRRQQSTSVEEEIMEKDKIVRQSVADLYVSLNKMGNKDISIKLLADHVAIMVDMINDFKNR